MTDNLDRIRQRLADVQEDHWAHAVGNYDWVESSAVDLLCADVERLLNVAEAARSVYESELNFVNSEAQDAFRNLRNALDALTADD